MMAIENSSQINGVVARQLRKGLDLGLREFWGNVAISYSAGSSYETGRNNIPEPVKRLLFLEYVLHIPTDMTASDAAEGFDLDALEVRRKAREKLARVSALNKQAAGLLQQSLQEMKEPV